MTGHIHPRTCAGVTVSIKRCSLQTFLLSFRCLFGRLATSMGRFDWRPLALLRPFLVMFVKHVPKAKSSKYTCFVADHAEQVRATHDTDEYTTTYDTSVPEATYAPHLSGAHYAFDLLGRQVTYHSVVVTPSPSGQKSIADCLQGRFPRDYYMDSVKGGVDADDKLTGIQQCRKKIDLSSNVPGASALLAVFCVEHGHCFGFHVVPLEGTL